MDATQQPADDPADDLLSDLINDLTDQLAAGVPTDLQAYRERIGPRWSEFKSIAEMLEALFDGRQAPPGVASQCDSLHGDSLASTPSADEYYPADQGHASTPVEGLTGSVLGDFRLLRELGRGGMGIVYEAEQITLPRRVALKIMHSAMPWTPQQLFRFQQETHAAAILRHPHIIKIHEIGHDRGLHFYAMDLIDGGSIAELIERLKSRRLNALAHQNHRDSAKVSSLHDHYRKVAGWGFDLATGLQHAHEQGVIHRDVKPSNVLVDQAGYVWLADFGLARIPGASELTRSGERLGTLRYMSPEQALGQKMIDHRTDVYSLGATLYELTTLQPAFDDDDPVVLLRDVAEKQPVSPTHYAPALPRDLAVVIEKAMAKSPADRYSSAQELAEDLHRFLQGEPVRARPISPWARAARWANRHRLLASLGISTAFLTLVLAIAGPLWAWKYAQAAHDAQIAQAASDQNRTELQKLLTNTLITSTASLENTPHIDELHRDLVFKSLDHYAKLLEFAGHDRQVQLDVASGYVTLGRVIGLRFGERQSIPVFEKAVDVLQSHLSQHPQDREALLILQGAYFCLGAQGWNREAMGESVRILEELLATDPADRFVRMELGYSEQFYGSLCADDGDLRSALEFGLRSVNRFEALAGEEEPDPECRSGWAYGLVKLAMTRRVLGDFVGAERDIAKALDVTVPIRDFIDAQLRSRIGFASGLLEYGDLLCRLGRRPEAGKYLTTALGNLTEIVNGFPDSDWARHQLIQAHLAHGEFFERDGDFASAEMHYRQAIKSSTHNSSLQFLKVLRADANYRLACLLWRTDRPNEARRHFSEAWRQQNAAGDNPQTIAAWYAVCPDPDLRDAQRGLQEARRIQSTTRVPRELGMCEFRAGNWQSAINALAGAQQSPRGNDALTDFYLAMAHFKLGNQAEAMAWLQRGVQREMAPSNTDWGWIQDARREAEALIRPGESPVDSD
ncbi:MAG: protein kinase [Pirellulales bacterium]